MKSLFAAVLVAFALPVWAGHCNSDHSDKGHDDKSHSAEITSAVTNDMDGYLDVAQETASETTSTEDINSASATESEEKPKSRYSKYYR